MTSKELLDLDLVPENLVVIGGGVIGLEIGMVFQKLGSKLTVVELTDSLLPGIDPEAVKVLEKSLEQARRDDPQVDEGAAASSRRRARRSSRSTGPRRRGAEDRRRRGPRGRRLQAEQRRARASRRSGVKTRRARATCSVDEHRRTNVPHVYAIGDVAGLPWLAHKASKEGIVAAEHAAGQAAPPTT